MSSLYTGRAIYNVRIPVYPYKGSWSRPANERAAATAGQHAGGRSHHHLHRQLAARQRRGIAYHTQLLASHTHYPSQLTNERTTTSNQRTQSTPTTNRTKPITGRKSQYTNSSFGSGENTKENVRAQLFSIHTTTAAFAPSVGLHTYHIPGSCTNCWYYSTRFP